MEGITPEDLQKAIPIPGVLCIVDELPDCDFCGDGSPGPYDFRTREGYWAHGCQYHWEVNRATKNLGVGNGQYWMAKAVADQRARHLRQRRARPNHDHTRETHPAWCRIYECQPPWICTCGRSALERVAEAARRYDEEIAARFPSGFVSNRMASRQKALREALAAVGMDSDAS